MDLRLVLALAEVLDGHARPPPEDVHRQDRHLRVLGFGLRISDFGFWVSDFGFKV